MCESWQGYQVDGGVHAGTQEDPPVWGIRRRNVWTHSSCMVVSTKLGWLVSRRAVEQVRVLGSEHNCWADREATPVLRRCTVVCVLEDPESEDRWACTRELQSWWARRRKDTWLPALTLYVSPGSVLLWVLLRAAVTVCSWPCQSPLCVCVCARVRVWDARSALLLDEPATRTAAVTSMSLGRRYPRVSRHTGLQQLGRRNPWVLELLEVTDT